MSNRDASTADTPSPRLPCDIVMAGGVTSGIIYPGAVHEIAKRYDFHAIGGTSVGAIAAAVTAAAEFGRRMGTKPDAFDFVSTLPDSLGKRAPDRRSRLYHLFAPEPDTRGFMGLLTAVFAAQGTMGRLIAVANAAFGAREVALATGAALLAGSWVVFALATERSPIAFLALIADAALVVTTFTLAFAFVLLRRWLPAWRRNGYGACTGLTAPGEGGRGWERFSGLTPWVHASIQAAAGRRAGEAPLTFGDLWGAPPIGEGRATGATTAFIPRSIELAMVASDISRNRSVQLPFLETPSPIYFERSTLERYFPDEIVAWMVARAGSADPRFEVPEGCHRLPPPQDIPVSFAARLSLSFPILLCAVPLLTPDFEGRRTAAGKHPLRKVWFSDGGLTSNFPVHFFDRPMPAHPTFCLNLVAFDAQVAAEPEQVGEEDVPGDSSPPDGNEARPAKPIEEPKAEARRAIHRPPTTAPRAPHPGSDVWQFVTMSDGNRMSPAPFTAFDAASGTGLAPFLGTLVNTARFWSDNQLIIAPGVRDRVVHIALRDDEGGLNLDMDARVIVDLDRRGRAAGAKIAARFASGTPVDPETGRKIPSSFPRHRWVRYRAFMAAVEDLSRRFCSSLQDSAVSASGRGEPSLDEMIRGTGGNLGYPPGKGAGDFYDLATRGFDDFGRMLARETARVRYRTFDVPRKSDMTPSDPGSAPRPKMSLKLRPLIDNDPRAENGDPPRQELATAPDPVEGAAS